MSELHGVTDISSSQERLAEEERLRRVRESQLGNSTTYQNGHYSSSSIGIGVLNAFSTATELIARSEKAQLDSSVRNLFHENSQNSLRINLANENTNNILAEKRQQADTLYDSIKAYEKLKFGFNEMSESAKENYAQAKADLNQLYGDIHKLENSANHSDSSSYYHFKDENDALDFCNKLQNQNVEATCVNGYVQVVNQGSFENGSFESSKVANDLLQSFDGGEPFQIKNPEEQYYKTDEYGKSYYDEKLKAQEVVALSVFGGTLGAVVGSLEGVSELNHIANGVGNAVNWVREFTEKNTNQMLYGERLTNEQVQQNLSATLDSKGLKLENGKIVDSDTKVLFNEIAGKNGALMLMIHEQDGGHKAIEDFNQRKALERLSKDYVEVCKKCPNLPRNTKGNVDIVALQKMSKAQLKELGLTEKERAVIVKVGSYAEKSRTIDLKGRELLKHNFSVFAKNTWAGTQMVMAMGFANKFISKAMSEDEDLANLKAQYNNGRQIVGLGKNASQQILTKVKAKINRADSNRVKNIKSKRNELKNKRDNKRASRESLKKSKKNLSHKKDEKLAKKVSKDMEKNFVVTPFGRFKQHYANLKKQVGNRLLQTRLGSFANRVFGSFANALKGLAEIGNTIKGQIVSFAGSFLMFLIKVGACVALFIGILAIILNFLEGGVTDQVIYKLYESLYKQEEQWLANLEGISKDEHGNFEIKASAENAEYYLQNPNRFLYDQTYGVKLSHISKYMEWYFLGAKNYAPYLHIFYTGSDTNWGVVMADNSGDDRQNRITAGNAIIGTANIDDVADVNLALAPQIYIDPFFTPNRVQDTNVYGMNVDYFTWWGMMKPIGIGKRIYSDYFEGEDILPSYSLDSGFNSTTTNFYSTDFSDSTNASRVGKPSEATAVKWYGDVYVQWKENDAFLDAGDKSSPYYYVQYVPKSEAESLYSEITEISYKNYHNYAVRLYDDGDLTVRDELTDNQERFLAQFNCHDPYDNTGRGYAWCKVFSNYYEKTVNATYPWNDNDVISIVTIMPNFQLTTGLTYGGHTSNIKDILCMLDVLEQFDESDKDDDSPYFTQNLSDSVVIFTLKKWANNVIHTFRLFKVLFDADYTMYNWNEEFGELGLSYKTLSTYCTSLFELTHQQYSELSVVYYHGEEGSRQSTIYSYGASSYSTSKDGEETGSDTIVEDEDARHKKEEEKKTMLAIMMTECPDFDPDGENHYYVNDADEEANVSTYGCMVMSGFRFEYNPSSTNADKIDIFYPVLKTTNLGDGDNDNDIYWMKMGDEELQRICKFVPSDFKADENSFEFNDDGLVKPCFTGDFIDCIGATQPSASETLNNLFAEYVYQAPNINEPCWKISGYDDSVTLTLNGNNMVHSTPSVYCNGGCATGGQCATTYSFSIPNEWGNAINNFTLGSSGLSYSSFKQGIMPYNSDNTNFYPCYYNFSPRENTTSTSSIVGSYEMTLTMLVPANYYGDTYYRRTCSGAFVRHESSNHTNSCSSPCSDPSHHGDRDIVEHSCSSSCYEFNYRVVTCTISWKCGANHTAEFCGGHLIIDNYGIVFSFMDEDVDRVERFVKSSRMDDTEESSEDIIGVIGDNVDYTSFYTARSGIMSDEDGGGVDPTSRWGYGTLVMNGGYGDGYHYYFAKYGIPFAFRNYWGLNLMGMVSGGTTVWYQGGTRSLVGGASVEYDRDSATIFDGDTPIPSDSMKITGIIRGLNDIFSADVNIDYGVGMFAVSHNADNYNDYEGWTSDNMYIAILKYCQSWGDIYSFDITVNQGGTQISSDVIKSMVSKIEDYYSGTTIMSEARTQALEQVLMSVGRGNYSSLHHEHCFFGKDCDFQFTAHDYVYDTSHYCGLTDTSGYASYVYGLHPSRDFIAYHCEDFWGMDGVSSWTNGNTIYPLDIVVSYDSNKKEGYEDRMNHCYIYIGRLSEAVTTNYGVGIPADTDIWVHCTIKDNIDGNIYLEVGTQSSHISGAMTSSYGLGVDPIDGIRLTDIDGNTILYKRVKWE